MSFQRFRPPPDGGLSDAPRSHGLLPVGLDSSRRRFLLPLPQGEAFWIGATAAPDESTLSRLKVSAVASSGATLALPRRMNFGLLQFVGVQGPESLVAITRDAVAALSLRIADDEARIELVDPKEFEAATGQPGPAAFDSNAAYGGWLLP